MQILKKYRYYIFFAIISFILYYSSKKEEKKGMSLEPNTSPKSFTIDDGKTAVLAVKSKYGVDMAKIIERMFRWETGHFKSGQYKKTGSAGMEVGKWSYINKSEIEPYTVKMEDSDKSDGIDEFIVWKHPKFAAFYLADYILRHKGNWARWNTTNEQKQQVYRDKVNTIKPKFV